MTASTEFWVCSAGDERFLGKYSQGDKINESPTFVNDNNMAFFQNSKFWYLGSLDSWPPVTYYRCVDYEGCNAEEPTPPTPGKWVTNKKFGKDPIPIVQSTPCAQNDEL
jgi:hypothetical protein